MTKKRQREGGVRCCLDAPAEDLEFGKLLTVLLGSSVLWNEITWFDLFCSFRPVESSPT